MGLQGVSFNWVQMVVHEYDFEKVIKLENVVGGGGGDNGQREMEKTSSAGSCAVLRGFRSLPLTTGYC